jgi:hypothetical protein
MVAVFLVPATAIAETDMMTGLEAVAQNPGDLPDGDRQYTLLWDLTHGVYLGYEPADYYSQLVTLLAANDITTETTEAGIDNIDLSAYDILVINVASAANYGYGQSEVDAAVAFVENGGGLFIMGDNENVWNDFINPISEAFGTTCGVAGADDLINNFIDHEIFTGVQAISGAANGMLLVNPPSEEAAWDPAGRPLIALVESCAGVIITGDVNFCDNSYIANNDNQQFSLNAFLWLAESDDPTPVTEGTWGAVKALYW